MNKLTFRSREKPLNESGSHSVRLRGEGFTIVELLIVIVVIGILAAISIVAYNGIQNRANDTAIQNDLTNLAKKIQVYNAEHGAYPLVGAESGSGTATLPGIEFSPSKEAYFGTGYNLYVCKSTSDQANLSLYAKSKSGKVIAKRISGENINTNVTTMSSTVLCPIGVSSGGYWYAYGASGSTWNSWANH